MFGDFKLGDTRLSYVQKKLGTSKRTLTGDAAATSLSLCYQKDSVFVTFLSGELGIHSDVLQSIKLSRKRPKQNCTKWPSNVASTSTALGPLQLGMSKQAFMDTVKAEIQWEGETATVYLHSIHSSPQTTESLPSSQSVKNTPSNNTDTAVDILITIIGNFKNNALTDIQAWKVETL